MPAPHLRDDEGTAMGTLSRLPVGVMQAPVTPFDDEYRLDLATYERVVEFHTSTPGCSAIVALYNKAEPISLSLEERKQVAKVTVDVVDGRLPVVVHVGHPSFAASLELAKHAQAVGADAVVCISPYYWHSSEDDVKTQIQELCRQLDIGVMAYTSPHVESASVTPPMLQDLIAQHGNFLGLKDASFRMSYFASICAAAHEVREDFRLMTGVEYLLGSVVLGGTGSFSASGAVAPRLVYRLWDAIAAGDWPEARQLQHKVSHLYLNFKDYYPSSLKIGMELMGRPVGPCRPPLPTGGPETRERVSGVLKEFRIPETEPYGWEFSAA